MTKVFEFGEDTWSLGIHSTLPTCCGQIQGSRRAPDMKQKENSNMAVGSQVQSSLKKEWPFAVSAPATEEVERTREVRQHEVGKHWVKGDRETVREGGEKSPSVPARGWKQAGMERHLSGGASWGSRDPTFETRCRARRRQAGSW